MEKKKVQFPHEDSYDTETQGRVPKAKLATTVARESMKIFRSVQSLRKADRDQEEVKSNIKEEA